MLLVIGATQVGHNQELSVIAAGDISCPDKYQQAGVCRGPQVAAAAGFKDYSGPVLALGDLLQKAPARNINYRRYFFKNWPLANQRQLYPVPGNHDYRRGKNDRYNSRGYQHFLQRQGLAKRRAWYSWEWGNSWRMIALNSNCDWINCRLGGKQMRWLSDQLATSAGKCLAVYFHHPRFAPPGRKGLDNTRSLDNIWRLLQLYNADVVLNGHMHYYQRTPPLDSHGEKDPGGIPQFVVGTGGVPLNSLTKPRRANYPVAAAAQKHGFLRLGLGGDYYRWEFIDTAGQTLDQGQGGCEGQQFTTRQQLRYQQLLSTTSSERQLRRKLLRYSK